MQFKTDNSKLIEEPPEESESSSAEGRERAGWEPASEEKKMTRSYVGRSVVVAIMATLAVRKVVSSECAGVVMT